MEFAIKFLSLICMIAQKILCLISSAEYFFVFAGIAVPNYRENLTTFLLYKQPGIWCLVCQKSCLNKVTVGLFI